MQELHHRGVSEELTAAALQHVFGGGLNVQQHLEQLEDEQEPLPLAHAGEWGGMGWGAAGMSRGPRLLPSCAPACMLACCSLLAPGWQRASTA